MTNTEKSQLSGVKETLLYTLYYRALDWAREFLARHPDACAGIYNVVDSDPAPVAEWLPYLANILDAKPPLQMPAWLGRLLAESSVVTQMTSWRGSSNEKARKELGWEPQYASWREGFRAWVNG